MVTRHQTAHEQIADKMCDHKKGGSVERGLIPTKARHPAIASSGSGVIGAPSSNQALIDLIALQQALLVQEHGSFRMAAHVLGVKPSVVSRRVTGLEEEIGVSLFNRTSKGAQPTIAGVRFLKRGRAILSDISVLNRTAALNGTGEEGRLRFGIVTSIASGFARQLIGAFVASHPGLELEVVEESQRENIAGVRALTLDFALVTGRPLASGCEVEPLWHERVIVALPEMHPLATTQQIVWKQLEHERFIVSRVDPGPEIQDYIIGGLADLGRHPNVEQVSVQRETLLSLVGLGQGLSLVAEAEAGVVYPGVTFRPLDHEEIQFSLIWSTKNDNPAFRRFLSAARLRAAKRRAGRASSCLRVGLGGLLQIRDLQP